MGHPNADRFGFQPLSRQHGRSRIIRKPHVRPATTDRAGGAGMVSPATPHPLLRRPRRGTCHGRRRRNRSRLAPRSEVASAATWRCRRICAATGGGGVVRARPRWRTGRGRRRISVSCSMECPLGKQREPGRRRCGARARRWCRWSALASPPPLSAVALLLRRGGAQGGCRVPRRRLQMRRAHAPRPPGRCASFPLAASSLFRSDAIGLSFRALFCWRKLNI